MISDEELQRLREYGKLLPGVPVRCIDCVKRRNRRCDKVRANKYASRPCKAFIPDIKRFR